MILTVTRRLLRPNARTGALVALDQAISSVTNFAASLTGLALLDESSFGRFSLVLATYFFAVGMVRAYALDAMLLAVPGDDDATSTARRFALLCGAGILIGLTSISVIFRRPELTALGVLMPGLLGVEFLRVRSFHRRTPGAAVIADAAWALGLVVAAFAYWSTTDRPTALGVVLVWSLPAALIGVYVLASSPRRSSTAHARRQTHRLGVNYATTMLLRLGGLYSILLLIGARIGPAAVGHYGAARTGYGPVSAALSAFDSYFIPRHGVSTSTARQIGSGAVRASVAMAAITLTIAAVTLTPFFRNSFASIGDAGPEVASLLWPMGLFVTAQALSFPARSVLRRLLREKWMTWTQACNTTVLVAVSLATLATGDLNQLLLAMTITSLAFAGIWWAVAHHAIQSWPATQRLPT